ncbi:MAG: carboxypeptidase-like regulatory domain-containing protein [Bacteroidia bacterium]
MKYQISIPEPCHEKWSEMTPNEKGRFCAACSKTVVDFRRMNTKEIVNHLGKSSGRACGRFSQHQLGEHSIENNSSWTSWVATLGLILSLSPIPLAAQSNVEKTVQVERSNLPMLAKPQIGTTGATQEIVIRGRVMNESREEPLEGVSAHVEGTRIGGFTDEEGYFSFAMNSSFVDTSINVIISYVGYEAKVFCIRLRSEQTEYEVGPFWFEESDLAFLGEVEYTFRNPIRAVNQRLRHLVWGLRRLF